MNRLSFGVQSMQAHVLAELGRTHDPAGVERAVEWARDAGFEHINLDLIYGTPSETIDDWRRTLDGALALEPDHVSAYALDRRAGHAARTRRRRRWARARRTTTTRPTSTRSPTTRCAPPGFEWYEISNWARPGR